MSRKTDRIFDLPLYLTVRLILLIAGLSSTFRNKIIPGVLAFAFRRHKKYKRIIRKNLEITGIVSCPADIEAFMEKFYLNTARSAVETMEYMIKSKKEEDIDFLFDDHDFIYSLKGKPCIFMTAHLGNFDMFSCFFNRYDMPMNIIARRMDNPYFDRITKKSRERHGSRVIYQEGSIYYIGTGFQHNESCFMLADHKVPRQYGTWVNFFDLPAVTLTVPAYFALKMGVKIVPIFCLKENNSYRIVLVKNLPLIDGYSKSFNLWANTQRYTQIIEQVIRNYPDQWLWSYDRWRIEPTKEELESCNENYERFIKEGLSFRI